MIFKNMQKNSCLQWLKTVAFQSLANAFEQIKRMSANIRNDLCQYFNIKILKYCFSEVFTKCFVLLSIQWNQLKLGRQHLSLSNNNSMRQILIFKCSKLSISFLKKMLNLNLFRKILQNGELFQKQNYFIFLNENQKYEKEFLLTMIESSCTLIFSLFYWTDEKNECKP